MESKFTEMYRKITGNSVVEESSDNPNLNNYNGLPEPFTEVTFKADALKNPYIRTLSGELQNKIGQYIKEANSPDRKYRIVISAVTSMRNSMEYAGAQSGPLGHIVQLVEQEGPVTKGQFTVPLEVLDIKNAAWNAAQAPIPQGWRYDRFKHTKFADIMDSYNKGKQPNGTITTGGNN